MYNRTALSRLPVVSALLKAVENGSGSSNLRARAMKYPIIFSGPYRLKIRYTPTADMARDDSKIAPDPTAHGSRVQRSAARRCLIHVNRRCFPAEIIRSRALLRIPVTRITRITAGKEKRVAATILKD
jgi:hypothetical protein